MVITVLRLGERPERDHRINTHLALVARAFGAKKLIMFFNDPSLLASVSSICDRFGGDFTVDVRKKGGWPCPVPVSVDGVASVYWSSLPPIALSNTAASGSPSPASSEILLYLETCNTSFTVIGNS